MTLEHKLLSDHLSDLFDARAGIDPRGPAVQDAAVELTNDQLLNRVLLASEHLRSEGLEADDVIALQLPNGVDFITLLFAAWRIGCTVTPVNPALTDEETEYQLTDSNAALLIDLTGRPRFTGTRTISASSIPTEGTAAPVDPVLDLDSLALLIYTSGTTGRPKGVMLTHGNLVAMASMGIEALAVTPDDRSLLILPLFHVNGIVVSVLVPLLVGANTVVAGRFDPSTFFDLVERVRPTYFSAVPTIYAMLVQLPTELTPDSSSVRFGICGAAPAPLGLLGEVERRYGFPVLEGYGLSEGTCATTMNPVDGIRKAGTVGVALPGQVVKIVAADGSEVETGSTGQVAISGPNVMRGYLRRPDDTDMALVAGWLMTGDLGHVDTDGYLTIDGRVKDMIIRGGENIYPREIEDVLASHPDVVNVAVLGRPDPTWGEVVAAFVTVSTLTEAGEGLIQDLLAWCAHHLAPYKRPATIVVLPDMPLNAMGKINKLALRRELLDQSAG